MQILIEYFFNHYYQWKTGIEGWIVFKQENKNVTMSGIEPSGNEWDLPITRRTLCNMSYLCTITWQAHSHILHVGYTADLRDELESFPKQWKTPQNWATHSRIVCACQFYGVFHCLRNVSYLSNLLYSHMHNAGMFLSGNCNKIAQVAEHPSSNGKVSGSISGWVTFLFCWFKNYSALYSIFLWYQFTFLCVYPY